MSLAEKRCIPCEKGTPSLSKEGIGPLMAQVPGWELAPDLRSLSRHFTFDSYWAGVGFVNAVAWIAQSEKHHPDIELLYKKVKVSFSTHAAGGLTENDFICAAKVNGLVG